MNIPHTSPPHWPEELSPGRFASLIRRDSAEGCRAAILGLADDEGVALNGGRIGARDGPRAFRTALARYGTANPHGFTWPRVFDAGDIIPGNSLDETHARVTQAVKAILDAGMLPIAIGGGHDLTFAFVRALAVRSPGLAGVYLDAHLDVREEPGSGMAFRRLVEDCGVSSLHIHGFDPLVNTREHVEWFLAHGGVIHADLDSIATPPHFPPRHASQGCFVSVDLDVMDMAVAPGVSAPAPAGWPAWRVDLWALAAGREQAVRCFDIMELNPSHDFDNRTARLAARLFLSFLRGLAERDHLGKMP